MRTSDELTTQHKCSNYKHLPLSNYSPERIFKQCVEELTMRLLSGEVIEKPESELFYQLTAHGYHFVDTIERGRKLWLTMRNINRYVDSVKSMQAEQNQIHFLTPEESQIIMRGEHIQTLPSYWYINDRNEFVLVKIKDDIPKQTETEASGKKITIDPRENDETYAFITLARNLRDRYAPGAVATMQYHFLRDEYKRRQGTRGQAAPEFVTDFFTEDYGHEGNIVPVNEREYDIDAFFQKKWELEEEFPIQCSGDSCNGCGCFNACHYAEPPLKADISGLMKNPDDVQLSYNQRQVVNHNEGSLLVDSGAGAGKTTSITMRILKLLRDGVDPKKICLLTFTNAAAKEMLDRVAMYTRAILNDPEKAGQLPPELDINDITGKTFNGLCQQVIEDHYEELGFQQPPRVISKEMQYQMVHDVFDLYPDKIPCWSSGYFSNNNSIYGKNTASFYLNSAADKFLELVEEIKRVPEGEYRFAPIRKLAENEGLEHRYEVQLKMMVEDFEAAHISKLNGITSSGKAYITFQDQFLLVEKLLEIHPTLWDEYGFEHIIVDEVQDSNSIQLNLLQHIQNNDSYKSLCCVGDMQQSIYGFNGAEPENLEHSKFEGYFGETQYESIRENFRCSREVIGFTNNAIDEMVKETEDRGIGVAENEYERLIGTRPESHQDVKVDGYYSKDAQITDIAKQVKKDLENGVMPGDIMILSRNKRELKMIASKLTELQIPSVLKCPLPLMENSRVGTAISFMDSYLYGYEQGYFDYVNQLSGGTLFHEEDVSVILSKIEEFKTQVENHAYEPETVMTYLKQLDPSELDEAYQKFLETFQYIRSIDDLDKTLNAFKQHGASSTFTREATYDEVQLSTIHSAKGLESKILYCDIEKLDNPKYHERRLVGHLAKEYKECNRLEYVCYTRAKDKLVVSAPYVLSDNRGKPILNERLISAFHAAGKTYSYNFANYQAEKAGIRAAEIDAHREELEQRATIEYVKPRFEDFNSHNRNTIDITMQTPISPSLDAERDQVSLLDSVAALGINPEEFYARNVHQNYDNRGVFAALRDELRANEEPAVEEEIVF